MELLGQHQRVVARTRIGCCRTTSCRRRPPLADGRRDRDVPPPPRTTPGGTVQSPLSVTNGAAYPGGMLTFVDAVPPQAMSRPAGGAPRQTARPAAWFSTRMWRTWRSPRSPGAPSRRALARRRRCDPDPAFAAAWSRRRVRVVRVSTTAGGGLSTCVIGMDEQKAPIHTAAPPALVDERTGLTSTRVDGAPDRTQRRTSAGRTTCCSSTLAYSGPGAA